MREISYVEKNISSVDLAMAARAVFRDLMPDQRHVLLTLDQQRQAPDLVVRDQCNFNVEANVTAEEKWASCCDARQ